MLHRSSPLPLTLGPLRLHECLDEQVSGLRIEGQGIAQGLQVWTLLQEGFLEAHATCVEVLLWGRKYGKLRLAGLLMSWAAATPLPHAMPPVAVGRVIRGLSKQASSVLLLPASTPAPHPGWASYTSESNTTPRPFVAPTL